MSYKITLGGPWGYYQSRTSVPEHREILSVITRNEYPHGRDSGALARVRWNGYLGQLNAGVVRTLNQREDRVALEEAEYKNS